MNGALLTLLSTAVGVAISPAPLIELILVLFSKRRTINAITFIITLWVCTTIVVILGALGGQAADGGSSKPSPLIGWIFAILGLLLIWLGAKNWRNRADHSEPAMFAMVSKMGPGAVAFLAFGAVAMNPKNAVLLLAAGQVAGTSSSPWRYGLLFVLAATLPYWLAVGYALLGGDSAHGRLDRMRAWLVRNNRLIMGVICTLLGVVLVAKAASALLG